MKETFDETWPQEKENGTLMILMHYVIWIFSAKWKPNGFHYLINVSEDTKQGLSWGAKQVYFTGSWSPEHPYNDTI